MAARSSHLPDELISLIVQDGLIPPKALPRWRARILERTGASPSQAEVNKVILQTAQRHRINSDDILSHELLRSHDKVIKLSNEADEGPLRPSRLPDILKLLLDLSRPPDRITREFAADLEWDRAHPERPILEKPFSWQEALEEDGLGGEHWQGVFNKNNNQKPRPASTSSTSSGADDQLSSSSGSTSSSDDSLPLTPNRRPRRPAPPNPAPPPRPSFVPDVPGLDQLKERQYWAPGHVGVDPGESLQSWNPSSLAGAFAAANGVEQGRVRYWDEVDVVSAAAPSVLHLTQATFHSLLSTFLPTLSSLSMLDSFLLKTLRRTSPSLPHSWSPTIEAFASAVSTSLLSFRTWCSTYESSILAPPTPTSLISLLRLSHDVSLLSPTLSALVRALATFDHPLSMRQHPCLASSLLLNSLQSEVERAYEIGSFVRAEALQDVLCTTVRPLWTLLGDWVLRGHLGSGGGRNDFWVRRNEDVEGVGDPAFFRAGFELWSREGEMSWTVPRMMEAVAEDALECGKVVFLLRTLSPGGGGGGDLLAEWPPFAQLLGRHRPPPAPSPPTSPLSPSETIHLALLSPLLAPPPHFSPPSSSYPTNIPPHSVLRSFSQTLSSRVEETCAPLFATFHERLHRVFYDDSRFEYHLEAIQGVFLMRKGFEIGTFLGSVFETMDRGLAWTDFQLLNSTWRRAVGPDNEWTDPTLVRFRVAGRNVQPSSRSVKVFSHLQIEPETMMSYSNIFTFLLQVRRAKHLIDRLSLTKPTPSSASFASRRDLKRFYSLRLQLSWIVTTLFDFWMTVIQKEVESLARVVRGGATSVQALVGAHRAHVDLISERLLLTPEMAPQHRSVLILLDLCVSASDAWSTLHTPSPSSYLRHRSNLRFRRHRRRSSLSSLSDDDGNSDDEDKDRDDDAGRAEASFVSFVEESFGSRAERMGVDTEEMVKELSSPLPGWKATKRSAHLLNLSLVCRAFRGPAQAELFRHLLILSTEASRLLLAVLKSRSGARFALAVRSLRARGRTAANSMVHPEQLGIYVLVQLCPRMESMWLSRVGPINLEDLAAGPTLYASCCSIFPDIARLSRRVPTLALRRLSLSETSVFGLESGTEDFITRIAPRLTSLSMTSGSEVSNLLVKHAHLFSNLALLSIAGPTFLRALPPSYRLIDLRVSIVAPSEARVHAFITKHFDRKDGLGAQSPCLSGLKRIRFPRPLQQYSTSISKTLAVVRPGVVADFDPSFKEVGGGGNIARGFRLMFWALVDEMEAGERRRVAGT
ncbi:hypothetical protein RQP46_004668 [Phenoliferia psychrophenolica]